MSSYLFSAVSLFCSVCLYGGSWVQRTVLTAVGGATLSLQMLQEYFLRDRAFGFFVNADVTVGAFPFTELSQIHPCAASYLHQRGLALQGGCTARVICLHQDQTLKSFRVQTRVAYALSNIEKLLSTAWNICLQWSTVLQHSLRLVPAGLRSYTLYMNIKY